MDEVFPVLAGIVIALATDRVGPRVLRAVVVVVLGIAFGATASWISGELSVSWVYLAIDTAQVIGASLLTGALVVAWQRRRERRRFAG